MLIAEKPQFKVVRIPVICFRIIQLKYSRPDMPNRYPDGFFLWVPEKHTKCQNKQEAPLSNFY
jgi:hypothetical protein